VGRFSGILGAAIEHLHARRNDRLEIRSDPVMAAASLRASRFRRCAGDAAPFIMCRPSSGRCGSDDPALYYFHWAAIRR